MIQTPDGRSASNTALTDEPVPSITPGMLLHVMPTDEISLRGNLHPCVLGTAWGRPSPKGGLPIIRPGDTYAQNVPFSPIRYVAHPTGIKGGVVGGGREPMSTWHLPDRCPYSNASKENSND